MARFLGLDVSSASVKGVLVEQDGTVVAVASRRHTVTRPRPGWAEQDPERDWWQGVVAVCRELTADRNGRVAGVGVAALGPCLVVAGSDGRPLRPAILYGIDSRATQEIASLNESLGEDVVLARCGSPLSSQAVGPKLAWVAGHEPEVWERTRRFFTAGSYLVHRLTGASVLDHHSASQCVPLYDVTTNQWIEDWAEQVAPGLPLPRLVWAHEAVGVVSTEAAEATGIPPGVPVAGGTIDSWAEVAASGLRGPGRALLVYGTTMFLLETGTTGRADPRLWSTTGFAPGSRNLAAGIASAGALVTWVAQLAGGASPEVLFDEAAASGPGGGGLVALPYFAGERTPLFDPDARGLLLGLTISHTRGHVVRALMEGAAFAVRHNLDVMREAGSRTAALRAGGGGTRGGLWPQIVSDVTGLPQEVGLGASGAGVGAALFAAVAAGAATLETTWAAPYREVRPDPAVRETYDRLYRLYRDLYPATREHAHALADLQRASASMWAPAAGATESERT